MHAPTSAANHATSRPREHRRPHGCRLRPFHPRQGCPHHFHHLAHHLALSEGCARRRDPRDRHAERRARHVVEPGDVAELHGAGLTAVLAADPDLELGLGGPAAAHAEFDQRADALGIEDRERIVGQNAAVDVRRQEAAGVIARQAERGLREVVGAEREEVGVLGDAVGDHARARQLDHRADGVRDPGARERLVHRGDDERAQPPELLGVHHERDHDLGVNGDAGLADLDRRLADRLHLDLVDLGVGDREPAAAVAEHRVGLGELHHLRGDRADGGAELVRDLGDLRLGVGQELVQRRVEQPDRHRQAVHHPEQLGEVAALHRQDLGERGAPAGLVAGDDHLAHREDALGLEEHVLGAAQPDALGAERARGARVGRRVGVGADLEPAEAVDPLHQLAELAAELRRHQRRGAEEHLAGRAVESERVAFLEAMLLAAARQEHGGALGGVDPQARARGDAALAHAARDHRAVRGHAATRGQDADRRLHSVNILG